VAAVIAEAASLQQSGGRARRIGCAVGWAELAREWITAVPSWDESETLEIIEGRHPVVEQMLKAPDAAPALGSQAFVPNDAVLSCGEAQIPPSSPAPTCGQVDLHPPGGADRRSSPRLGAGCRAKRCRLGWSTGSNSRVRRASDRPRARQTRPSWSKMNETAKHPQQLPRRAA